eukprot:4068125-Prymnesium_polylepis.1
MTTEAGTSADIGGGAPDHADAVDALTQLRNSVLYSDTEIDWDAVAYAAGELGCDVAWVQKIKKQFEKLHVALKQARATANPSNCSPRAPSITPPLTTPACLRVVLLTLTFCAFGLQVEPADNTCDAVLG